jgi:hypothetical protein
MTTKKTAKAPAKKAPTKKALANQAFVPQAVPSAVDSQAFVDQARRWDALASEAPAEGVPVRRVPNKTYHVDFGTFSEEQVNEAIAYLREAQEKLCWMRSPDLSSQPPMVGYFPQTQPPLRASDAAGNEELIDGLRSIEFEFIAVQDASDMQDGHGFPDHGEWPSRETNVAPMPPRDAQECMRIEKLLHPVFLAVVEVLFAFTDTVEEARAIQKGAVDPFHQSQIRFRWSKLKESWVCRIVVNRPNRQGKFENFLLALGADNTLAHLANTLLSLAEDFFRYLSNGPDLLTTSSSLIAINCKISMRHLDAALRQARSKIKDSSWASILEVFRSPSPASSWLDPASLAMPKR